MRKSISVTFFSMVATLLVLGTAVLGCSERLLFSRYFAQERYEHAGQRGGCDPARGGLYRAAGGSAQGGRAGCPEHQAGDHRRERRGLPVFTDEEAGSSLPPPEMVGTDVVGPELMKKVAGDQPYHTLSTLDGVLTEKSYVSVRHMQDAQATTAAISSSAPPVRG